MGRWGKYVFNSADKVIVVVEVVAHTIADVLETVLVNETTGVTGWLGNIGAVLQVSLLLHLSDCGGGSVLLTVEEGVVFLRDL